MRRIFFSAILVLVSTVAVMAQNATVIGPITPGDCASFSSNTVIKDGGFPCPGSGGTLNLPNGTTATTQSPFSDNTTKVATDSFVQGAISLNSTHFAAGGTTTGSANAQVIATVSPPVFSLTGNPTVTFIAGFSNTGATTLNVTSTGVINILKKTPAGLVALVTGDIISGQQYLITYDGTQYELQTPSQIVNSQFSASVQSALTGTNGNILTGTGAFGFSSVSAVPLAQGGLGGSQAAATSGQIPIFPGSGGAAVPTTTGVTYVSCDITGVTDCSTNIQNAVNAAVTAGGGIIQLPCTGSGQILINAGVTIANGGIEIRGCRTELYQTYNSSIPAGFPVRGQLGTWINTTSTSNSPFTFNFGTNFSKIDNLAFTQTQPAEPATIASFTGSISGTTLTVSSGTGIAIGQYVVGGGVLYNTKITAGSGTSWTVSISQTVGSTAMSTEGSLWTPTVYPPTIRHLGPSLNNGTAGKLEVAYVFFDGVYDGIDAGTAGGSVGTSHFIAGDYYHDVNADVFNYFALVEASADVTRMVNIEVFEQWFPNAGASPQIIAYSQSIAEGIIDYRSDNPQYSNIFFFGLNRGIHLNGTNADGVTQGAQATNVDCDSTHICIFVDNESSGSPQYQLSVTNLTHFGVTPIQCCDNAVQIAANASNVSLTIVNANLAEYFSTPLSVLGSNDNLVVTNVRASFYNQGNGGFPLANAAAGSVVSLRGTVQGSNNNSAPNCSGACLDFSTPGQIPATPTNDNAGSVIVGEFVSASAAGGSVSLTSTTTANVTSISLTAGDWDVSGYCQFSPAASTVVSFELCGTSTTSATRDSTIGKEAFAQAGAGAPNPNFPTATTLPWRYSLAATTTVFLVANSSFTTSTNTVGGVIRARRVR